jgi:hypothetical protein
MGVLHISFGTGGGRVAFKEVTQSRPQVISPIPALARLQPYDRVINAVLEEEDCLKPADSPG